MILALLFGLDVWASFAQARNYQEFVDSDRRLIEAYVWSRFFGRLHAFLLVLVPFGAAPFLEAVLGVSFWPGLGLGCLLSLFLFGFQGVMIAIMQKTDRDVEAYWLARGETSNPVSNRRVRARLHADRLHGRGSRRYTDY